MKTYFAEPRPWSLEMLPPAFHCCFLVHVYVIQKQKWKKGTCILYTGFGLRQAYWLSEVVFLSSPISPAPVMVHDCNNSQKSVWKESSMRIAHSVLSGVWNQYSFFKANTCCTLLSVGSLQE